MALDTSIPMSYRGVQVESPVNQMANLYQLQAAQQANQLNAMKMEAAQREVTSQNELNAAYKGATDVEGNLDYNKLMRNLAAGGQGAQIPGIQKAMHEQQKIRLERQKVEGELVDQKLKRSRDFLDQIDPNSPTAAQDYLAWHNANHTDPVLGPVLKSMGVDQIAAFQRINQAVQQGKLGDLIEQSKVGMTKFQEARLPKPQAMDLHDRSVMIDMNPLSPTFKREISSQIKGTTAHETKMEGFRERELTEQARAHKATEAIAWKKLNQEMESGVTLTPDTLDTVAQIYNRTGQLPPLGLGKKAAEVKQRILNRATELSMAGPEKPNAEQRAGALVTAKQDVAAQSKAVKDFSTGVEGRQVKSFNTAIDHLETMDKLATALNNNDTRAFNAIGNAFSKQTGTAAPTNFEAAKAIVGGEVAKALAGSSMALKDREEIRDTILASSSPEQLKGTLNTLKQLLGGQLKSLNVQYETGTGRKDFSSKLTPAAKKELDKLQAPSAPVAGAVQDGYRFKGGNPADKNSWEKVK